MPKGEKTKSPTDPEENRKYHDRRDKNNESARKHRCVNCIITFGSEYCLQARPEAKNRRWRKLSEVVEGSTGNDWETGEWASQEPTEHVPLYPFHSEFSKYFVQWKCFSESFLARCCVSGRSLVHAHTQSLSDSHSLHAPTELTTARFVFWEVSINQYVL